MNNIIKQLYEQAHEEQPPLQGVARLTTSIFWIQAKKFNPELFAELIVKACADAADVASGSTYPGDYVAEQMGYGTEEGITAWRTK